MSLYAARSFAKPLTLRECGLSLPRVRPRSEFEYATL